MREVTVYWNNICVLHKAELNYLNKVALRLEKKDIRLNLRCFGLGYPEHLSDYLRRKEAILPDVIVSADLEVFEDERVRRKVFNELYPLCEDYELKDKRAYRNEYMLPFVIIPLVFYSKTPFSASLKEVVNENKRLAFGGINNSAGKTVVKLLLEKFGQAKTREFVSHSLVTGMPVESFQAVKREAAPLALVPSIFALSDANGFTSVPLDGCPCVPSYITIKRSASREVREAVMAELLSDEFLSFFVKSGHLLSARAGSAKEAMLEEANLAMPSNAFLETLDHREFYRFYCSLIPSADKRFC